MYGRVLSPKTAGSVKAPDGYREVKGVYLREDIPFYKNTPDGDKGRSFLLKKLEQARYDEFFHPSVAVGNIKRMGFKPTVWALPMSWEKPGDTSYRSGQLHAHQAGGVYLVHRDASHPSDGIVEHTVKDLLPALVERIRSKAHKPDVLEVHR